MDLALPGALVVRAVSENERRELVAAEAGRGVTGPHGLLEAASGLDEQLVARLVAETVVDRLEAVEVDEEHRGAGVTGAAAAESLADPLGEQGAVGQVGERVVLGVVLQLGLQPDPFGHVPAVEDQPALVAVDGGLDVEPVSGAGSEPALDPGGGFLAGRRGQKPPYFVDHAPQVLGMDDRGELGADEIVGLPPVDTGGGRADVPEYAGGGGDHDDVTGPLDQGAEVVLLLRQLLGERDVVDEHDALPYDQGEHHHAAGEDHDAVDPAALDDVVEDAEGADGRGEIRRQRGQ